MNRSSKITRSLAVAFGALTLSAKSALADSFSNVGTASGGLGTWAKNLSNEIMGSVSLLEAAIYFGAVVCFILGVTTLIKHRKSRGQDGDMGMMAVWFIAAVMLMAAPSFMGGMIKSTTGSGAVTTVKPSTTPSFLN